jgi:hypothetical protein
MSSLAGAFFGLSIGGHYLMMRSLGKHELLGSGLSNTQINSSMGHASPGRKPRPLTLTNTCKPPRKRIPLPWENPTQISLRAFSTKRPSQRYLTVPPSLQSASKAAWPAHPSDLGLSCKRHDRVCAAAKNVIVSAELLSISLGGGRARLRLAPV